MATRKAQAAVNPNEVWVTMTHPDISGAEPATVTLAAFDEMWADKGWIKGDTATAPAGAAVTDTGQE